MRHLPSLLAALALLLAPAADAAATMPPQTVLGRKFQIRNLAGGASGGTVRGDARKTGSTNTVAGDPTTNSATLEVIANGGTASDQTFNLPAAGWSPISGGFKFSSASVGGAVRQASIRKMQSGIFRIKIQIDGRGGTVGIVPPNPGDDGGFILTLGGGASSCVAFGGTAGGAAVRDTAAAWRMKNPI